jgi:hypothetical protein
MASKKQQIGKGKGVATSSGVEEHNEGGKFKKRTQDQIDRDAQLAWEMAINEKGAKAERHIKEEGWPLHYGPIFRVIREQGMGFWFDDCEGYNLELVRDFYHNIIGPVPGTFGEPGASITSQVAGIDLRIDVDDIARAWNYMRPVGPFTYPCPEEEFDQRLVAETLYEKRSDATNPHKPGRFVEEYRFLNQLVCYNIFPPGREAEPSIKVGNLLVTFMSADCVCDWALFAFGVICDFKSKSTSLALRMPFPCLISKIVRGRYAIPRRMITKNDVRNPGDLDVSFVKRSKSHSKASGSVLTPPPAAANQKAWLEKILGCLSCMAKSNQKIKREGRERDRRLQDIEDRLKYEERRRHGDASAGPSFQPRQWEPLEVSDDFAAPPDDDDDAQS